MISELANWGFEGKIKAAFEPADHKPQTVDLGDWQAVITFIAGRGFRGSFNQSSNGKMLIVQLDRNEFIVTGTLSRITFRPTGANAGKEWQYLKVEEGYYKDGAFHSQRILNGDETDWGGPYIGENPVVLKIELTSR